ncbi:Na+/H+ antiporter NhaA [Dactylosporangium sp. AC04546]|uniref:Na+/H+ antiporter NhaA n=1 Tax=Dactylosporangium sp. AC04546 TaxID=2862460 RepID=UPI001EE135B3|nr:Na+/H+ antiporter NhaA [Dactylosporangium sp. AC04546]WVK88519.1 Na+/H+ antiporter NhaA [Dactylosporangium sp. AC04546]
MYRPFERGTWAEVRRIGDVLRTETIGGLLLLVAAAAALVWANSPWAGAYYALSEVHLLGLTLAEWAADGLLAVFFFVAGLELKREFVAGDLRDPRRALLPVAAAVGGMVAPALVYVAINVAAPGGAPAGWAVPIATDIAFALAVLGVINTHLPASLRTFLLTLAVVDDLLAIVVIAIVFTGTLAWLPLLLAVLPLAGFAVLVRRGAPAWLLWPLALATWALVHASGIHATVAGVLLAFTVRTSTSERFEHRLRPLSAGVAVPVFAFFAAGVTVTGSALGVTGPITLGVATGLVLGKTIGVAGTTWLVVRLTRARLAEGLAWLDVIGLALLGGVGFTVSLLVAELAFGPGSPEDSAAKAGILGGSLIAAVLAAVVLRARNRHYRRLRETEETDADGDGVPDVYQ